MDLSPFNVYPVTQNDDPAYDPATEYLGQGTPVLVGGAWEVTRVVTAKSAAQIDREARDAAYDEDVEALKASPEIRVLLKKRPDQIDAYINDNVNDLAGAKAVLRAITKAVAVLAHTIVD